MTPAETGQENRRPPIECADCGASYQARRSDAKYCPSCRLLRILVWSASRWKRVKRCDCGETYRPIRQRDFRCGHCTPPARRAEFITCGICGRKAVESFERVGACAVCVKHPDRQADVRRALHLGQAARREAHGFRDTVPPRS